MMLVGFAGLALAGFRRSKAGQTSHLKAPRSGLEGRIQFSQESTHIGIILRGRHKRRASACASGVRFAPDHSGDRRRSQRARKRLRLPTGKMRSDGIVIARSEATIQESRAGIVANLGS
jgi:hypothetical protein